MPTLRLATCFLILFSVVPTSVGAGWLPKETLFPRLKADPREPRIGISIAGNPDRWDAALGAPIPLLEFQAGTTPVVVVLEGAALFRLGRRDSFFPLETFDGLFGLGLESVRGPWRGRLRFMHQSAHLADGSPDVTYPGNTFSRETVSLDLAFGPRERMTYVRVGTPWHTAPAAATGLEASVGGQWELGQGSGKPYLAVHLEAESERAWRVRQTFLAGWITGTERRFLAGFRYQNGPRFYGQFWHETESLIALELQFSPQAGF